MAGCDLFPERAEPLQADDAAVLPEEPDRDSTGGEPMVEPEVESMDADVRGPPLRVDAGDGARPDAATQEEAGSEADCNRPSGGAFTATACTAGKGECAAGRTACVDGHVLCLAERAPTPERCDGRDNNCDGVIDDGFHAGQVCTVGVGACRREGHISCAPDGASESCDALAGPPAGESCNDRDDDCDGLVDYTLSAGKIESACVCAGVGLQVQMQTHEPQHGEPAGEPECAVSAEGIGMAYQLNRCPQPRPGEPPPYPWAQCMFQALSLNRFDADHRVVGELPAVLEVRFCVNAGVHGALNLYYGTYPRRKRLRLLTSQEGQDGLVPGCYTRFFASSDAECPVFAGPLDPKDAANELDAKCRSGCDAGRWSDKSSACSFDYDNVPLYLTAEFCAAGVDDGAVTVTGVQLRFDSASCVCRSDSDCRDLSKPICSNSAAMLPFPACDKTTPRCAGLCMAP